MTEMPQLYKKRVAFFEPCVKAIMDSQVLPLYLMYPPLSLSLSLPSSSITEQVPESYKRHYLT